MRASVVGAGLIALAVGGAALLCQHYGVDQVLADWLAGRVESLQGMRRLPLLQQVAPVAAALLAAGFVSRLAGLGRRMVFLFALAFLLLVLWPVLALQGIFFAPLLSVAAALLAGLLVLLLDAGAGQDAVLAAPFLGRLSGESFAALRQSGDSEKLAGQRYATVLAGRILNEASLLKQLRPEQWQALTAGFQQRLRDLLLGHGAFIESSSPAELRALFGFPVGDENHALSAARAALECRRHLADWEHELAEHSGAQAKLGLALSSGEIIVTRLTVAAREEWRASGAAVDLAEALCARNASYGSRLLASAAVLEAAQDGLEVRPLELLPQGDAGALAELYEVLALKRGLSEEEAVARDAFWQGVILLRKGDNKAAARQFERAELKGAEDAVLAHFKAKAGAK